MTEHPDRLSWLAYIEGDETDHDAMTLHLSSCAACRAAFEDLQDVIMRLGDGSIFSFVEDASVEDDCESIREELTRASSLREEAEVAATRFLASLSEQPVESWVDAIEQHPGEQTAALAGRLVATAERELDRQAARSLVLLDAAERVAASLWGAESQIALGDVWKQRSNALRTLGDYEGAVDAAALAEAFYESVPAAHYEIAQAQYTRAAALFKMTRYADALEVLATARQTLEDYGPSAPLGKVMTLDAIIRTEQGNVAQARDCFLALLPVLHSLDEPLETARVHANLAECNLRMGALDDAAREARFAIDLYRALGNTAEEIRTSWTLAMIELDAGNEEALDQLYTVAAAFEAIGMGGDAGFVSLDIVEELLRREEWSDAAAMAKGAVELFLRAGVSLASTTALHQLRQAVEKREASVDDVRTVRESVSDASESRTNPDRPTM